MIHDEIDSVTVVPDSVGTAIKTISGKWKPSIILHLIDQDLRYSELRQAIPAISEKVLIQQLKELRKEGIVTRVVYAQIPPRVEYSLTSHGRTMEPLLELLSAWGTSHLSHLVALAGKPEGPPV